MLRTPFRSPAPTALVVLLVAITTAFIWAGPASATGAGRDISYPQCGRHLPRDARFAVLGANGGAAFTRNPCLKGQLKWAKTLPNPPAFYANTGNPGPAYSTHWPIGQTEPAVCSAHDPNSLGCSLDYGWNAAFDSFSIAVDAAQQLHRVDRVAARARVANVDWWLDVEILNSWQTLEDAYGPNKAAQLRDMVALLGEVRALWRLGVQRVGIYSTTYQWSAITGAPSITRGWFRANPAWIAGFDGPADAAAGCHRRSFTGGPVLMTQYLGADGFDANAWCQ